MEPLKYVMMILLVVLPMVGCGDGGDEYRLDLESPVRLTSDDLPMPPTRVDIYLTGPRVYIDALDTPRTLSKRAPDYSTKNRTEISELASVLQQRDNTARIRNAPAHKGYTYHLLLFQDANKTVMHFRVFEPSDIDTIWCDVDPRNETGFVYFNKAIGAWLHSRVNVATNASPRVIPQ